MFDKQEDKEHSEEKLEGVEANKRKEQDEGEEKKSNREYIHRDNQKYMIDLVEPV